MSEPEIPGCFSIADAQAITTLVQRVAECASPPLVRDDGQDVALCREAWDQWLRDKGLARKLPSYVDLFRAQANDDDSTSLSAEDWQINFVIAPNKEEALAALARNYGYPEAVILKKDNEVVVRMPNGSFWEGVAEDGRYHFKPMVRATGRDLESNVATGTLVELDARFKAATFPERLVMKTTMHGRGVPSIQKGSTINFAGRSYVLGNSNSRIAYLADSEVTKYYLSQPQNGCVAASILNGGIFSGVLRSHDDELLRLFYQKLLDTVADGDGRIMMGDLLGAVAREEIPGLSAREVKPEEVVALVRSHKPVIAVVPYFMAHAFLVLGVDSTKKAYRAVDTVTGTVVRQDLASAGAKDGDVRRNADEKICNEPPCLDEAMGQRIRAIVESQTFFVAGPLVRRTFYHIEIINPATFFAWVRPVPTQK